MCERKSSTSVFVGKASQSSTGAQAKKAPKPSKRKASERKRKEVLAGISGSGSLPNQTGVKV